MSFSPLRDYFLTTTIVDISTADEAYVAVPAPGKVVAIRSVINNAITVGDAALTAKINGTAITGGAITVTQSGSAAGDTDLATPSALNDVQAGDALEIETDGGSSTACRCTVTFQIRK
jgi:hypothetical protein